MDLVDGIGASGFKMVVLVNLFKRLSDASLDHERQMEEKQRAWLAAHKR
jgi:hypothetical protein